MVTRSHTNAHDRFPLNENNNEQYNENKNSEKKVKRKTKSSEAIQFTSAANLKRSIYSINTYEIFAVDIDIHDNFVSINRLRTFIRVGIHQNHKILFCSTVDFRFLHYCLAFFSTFFSFHWTHWLKSFLCVTFFIRTWSGRKKTLWLKMQTTDIYNKCELQAMRSPTTKQNA